MSAADEKRRRKELKDEYLRRHQREQEERERKRKAQEQIQAVAHAQHALRTYREQGGEPPTWAINELGSLAGPKAFPRLREFLQDTKAEVQVAALHALARGGDPEAAALVKSLAGRDGLVSIDLAAVLQEIDPGWACRDSAGDVFPELVAALQCASDAARRRMVIRALGATGDERALEPLFAALKDGELREAAEHALARMGAAQACVLLQTVDEDATIRNAASRRLRESSAWATSVGTLECAGTLLAGLCSENGQVRQNATNALNRIRGWRNTPGTRSAIPSLIVAAARQHGSSVQTAAWALDSIDADWAASREAVDAIPSLLAILAGAQPDSPEAAATILAKIPQWPETAEARSATPLLISALAHERGPVRRLVKQALQEIDPAWTTTDAARRAVPSLLAMLRSTSLEMRTEAVEILEGIGGSDAYEGLVRRLDDDEQSIRARAASILGRSRDRRVVGLLVRELQDTRSPIREASAAILGEIGDEHAIEPLTTAVRDPARDLRTAAARALRAFPAARDEIRNHLSSLLEACLDLVRSDLAAAEGTRRWDDLLHGISDYLHHAPIVTGISSSSESDYVHDAEETYAEPGYCLCGSPRGGTDKTRTDTSLGVTTSFLAGVGEPTVWWLASGRLLEVETTHFSSHAARCSGSHHWSTQQRIIDVETFLQPRFNQKEALRRCCSEIMPILEELCGPGDEAFAVTANRLTDAGLLARR